MLEQKLNSRQINVKVLLIQPHRKRTELHQNGATHRNLIDVCSIGKEDFGDQEADVGVLVHVLCFSDA